METRDILPTILATITRKSRQQVMAGVDFAWLPNLWVTYPFRWYEIIFGRRCGIRPFMSAWTQEGVTYYQAHSFEAALVLLEQNIRGIFKWRMPIKIWIPVLKPAGMGILMPSPYLFAIALDNNSGYTSTSGTSATVTGFVVAGTNPFIFSGIQGDSTTDLLTSVTYNAVNMTVADKTGGVASHRWIYGYYIQGQSGTHNLVANFSGSADAIRLAATSYTGVTQTGLDSHNTNTATAATSITLTTTVVAPSCWTAAVFWGNGGVVSASTGTTARINQGSDAYILGDSNGTVGTGSQSMAATAPLGSFDGVIVSFAPFTAVGPANVKTWDGITQSTGIKTYNGVTLVNTKTVIGIT